MYDRALQSDNLRAAFRKNRYLPIGKKTVVAEHQLMQKLVFKGKQNEFVTINEVEKSENEPKNNNNLFKLQKASDFLQKRGGDVLRAVTMAKKPRRNISTVVAGKAII